MLYGLFKYMNTTTASYNLTFLQFRGLGATHIDFLTVALRTTDRHFLKYLPLSCETFNTCLSVKAWINKGELIQWSANALTELVQLNEESSLLWISGLHDKSIVQQRKREQSWTLNEASCNQKQKSWSVCIFLLHPCIGIQIQNIFLRNNNK